MPSQKVLEQKAKIVADLSADFKAAQSMVFVEYRGLTVAQDTEMRAEMRKAGVKYQVIKNTLSGRALDLIGVDGLDSVLTGPTAIAFSKDEITAPAKVVKTFADKYDLFKIKGGVLEGKVIDEADVRTIAAIPSKEVLYGQVVFTLLAPITGLAVALNAICEKGEAAGVSSVAELAVVAAE